MTFDNTSARALQMMRAMRMMAAALALAIIFSLCAVQGALADEGDDLTATTPAHDTTPTADSNQTTAGNAAPTPFKKSGVYFITSKTKKKLVVGMKGNKRTNDVSLALNKRKNTNLLKFRLKSAGKAGLFYVQNVATGRYLYADADDEETAKSVIMNLGEGKKYRKWQVNSSSDGTVTFTNEATGRVLNLNGGKIKKGARLNLSAADGSQAQRFKLVKAKANKKEVVQLNVPCYMQNPQLPTGCESVALTNALRYWGYDLSKTEIARKWMPYGSSGVYNFIGSPYDWSGWIICAPGIARTANKYLDKTDGSVEAVVVKGKSLKSLRKYLDRGCPVVVWTTIGMGSPGSVQAVKSGYPLRGNNHAVVLTGYNPKNGKYRVADSLAGKVWRNGSRFTLLYNMMGKQAVVLTDE